MIKQLHLSRCTMALLCFFMMPFSHAQDTTPSDTTSGDIFEFSLEELLNFDVELRTGSFLDLDLKESPVSLTLITSDQVQISGARHLSELLEIYVPGFQYQVNKWNGIIWGMRGVGPSRNTKFIFLVNGHKMNHESRDGAMSELDLGMLSDIERVEVLRGPAGLVYGSGAIAGVINVVTKDVDEVNNSLETNITATKMEAHGSQFELNYNKRINDDFKLGFHVGARYSEGVGQENSRIWGRGSWPYPAWITTDVPQGGVPTTGSAWSTPGNFKTGITAEYKKLKLYSRITHQVTNASGWFPVELWPNFVGGPDSTASSQIVDGQLESYEGFYGSIVPWSTNRRQYIVDNVMVAGNYEIPVGENNLVLTAGFDGVTNRIQFQDLKAYATAATDERNDRIDETFGERRYDVGATYMLNSKDKLQMAFGYQFRLFDIGSDLSGKNYKGEYTTHPVVSDVTYINNAVFTEGMYELNDKLSINFGLRFDAHTRTIEQGGILSPKLALIGKIDDKNIIKLIGQSSANNGSADIYELNRWHYTSAGEVFDEWHYELPNNQPSATSNIIPPAPTQEELHAIKPERATSFELSSVHEIKKRLYLAPSISYTTINNLFVWEQSIFRMLNGGKYNALSLELETKYVSEKVQFGLNHTFQKPINIDVNKTVSYEKPVFDGYDSTEVSTGVYYYTPVQATDGSGNPETETVEIEYVKAALSQDGKNFLNMVTNVTKFYIDYSPSQYFTFHSSVRTFWGLAGRRKIHEENPAFPYLNAHAAAIVKWNASITLKPDEKWRVSLMVYDILGTDRNPIHTLRWQQMAEPSQTDLFGSDLRTWSLDVAYKF